MWILCHYFALFINIMFVITKAGGNRPCESLATLCQKEGATFYLNLRKDNPEIFSLTFLIPYICFDERPEPKANWRSNGLRFVAPEVSGPFSRFALQSFCFVVSNVRLSLSKPCRRTKQKRISPDASGQSGLINKLCVSLGFSVNLCEI